jgi:hypothetical protein
MFDLVCESTFGKLAESWSIELAGLVPGIVQDGKQDTICLAMFALVCDSVIPDDV